MKNDKGIRMNLDSLRRFCDLVFLDQSKKGNMEGRKIKKEGRERINKAKQKDDFGHKTVAKEQYAHLKPLHLVSECKLFLSFCLSFSVCLFVCPSPPR